MTAKFLRRFGAGVAALTLSLTLAACGDDADDSADGNGEGGGDKKITLGFPGGIGPTDIPAILALEDLKEDGWETSYIEFDSPDVQTQALIGGDINIASMGPATVMTANTAGADMRMIAINNKNDLMVVAAGDIQECSDLQGKPVAFHSEGSTSTAHLRAWLKESCEGTEPEWLVISGSANRTNALIEGQISGTIVRTEDWIGGTTGVDTDAHVLAHLAESQPTLLTQTIVVDAKNLESDANKAFLNAMQEQFNQANEDPAAFAEKAAGKLDAMDQAVLEEIYSSLTEQGVFPESNAIVESDVQDTISFYEESGTIDSGEVTPDKVAAFDILD